MRENARHPDVKAAAGPPELARIAVAGIAWTTAQTWMLRLTGMVTVIILARTLTPADFGIVAVAMALPPVLQLIADMGLSTYILQADRPTSRTYSTFFWYAASAGLVLSALLLVASPLIGQLLGEPEVAPISAALAPVALLVALGAVPVTMLRRGMRFQAIAVQSVVAGLVSQVVAVVLALTGAGVWALVWQTLSFQAVALVLVWFTSGFRPAFTFSVVEFVRMSRFGIKVVGAQVVEMATVWVVNLVIVAVLGTATLGYLNIAQRFIALAQELTTTALGAVSTVMFPRVRDDLDRLRSAFLRSVAASYTVVIPAMVFVVLGAPQLVPLLFGDQWGASIVPAQLLAVAAVFACLAAVDYSLFIARGKPGRWFVYFVLMDAVIIALAVSIAPHGLVAYTMAFAATAAAATLARWTMLAIELRTSWWRVAEPFGRTLVPGVCAAAAGGVVILLVKDWPAVPTLVALGAALMLVYLPLIRVFSRDAWMDVGGMLRGVLRRRHSAAATREEPATP